jgi:transcriptional regulator with XRE-family HTH domain
MATIGENIKRLRLERGIKTQTGLAKLLDVPQPQAWDWENDRYKELDTSTLIRIAKKLQVSLDELIRGRDEEYDRIARDLPRHVVAGQSAPHRGGSDVPASAQARIRELSIENEDLKNRLAQVQEATSRVIKIVAEFKDREAAKSEAGSGKPHRKTGR